MKSSPPKLWNENQIQKPTETKQSHLMVSLVLEVLGLQKDMYVPKQMWQIDLKIVHSHLEYRYGALVLLSVHHHPNTVEQTPFNLKNLSAKMISYSVCLVSHLHCTKSWVLTSCLWKPKLSQMGTFTKWRLTLRRAISPSCMPITPSSQPVVKRNKLEISELFPFHSIAFSRNQV